MSDSQLTVVYRFFRNSNHHYARRPRTRKKFFEFFTVPIRNAHTRAAYYRAVPGEPPHLAGAIC